MGKKEDIVKTVEEEEIEQDKRFRLFSIILYEDSNSYDFDSTISLLKSMGEYAYIKHRPEENEKKEHVHFVLRLKNQKKISKLNELTGIPMNHIKNVRSERAMLRYLIHLDENNKIKYNIDDVKTSSNYWRTYRKAVDNIESEETIINNIYSFITDLVNSNQSRMSMIQSLIQYVNYNCYDTIYKRYRQEYMLYLNSLL